jgi:hypothetical protein
LYGLAVFNNGGLQEVCAARADPTGQVRFDDIGCDDVLYFLTWFEWRGGSLVQHLAGPPVVARPSGRCERLAMPNSNWDEDSAEVVIGPLPRNEELVVRAIIPSVNADGWQELGIRKTDETGALKLKRALLNTVFVVFHKDGRPASRPFVAVFKNPNPIEEGPPATVYAERF